MYMVTDGVKYMHAVNVDIFACKNYGTFPKIGFSHRFIFAFLILLPLCGIIKVILYMFSQIFYKSK